MDTILLLRSFGDFVIALYHLPADKPVRLVASSHLKDLYQSFYPFLNPAQQSVQFLDIGIQHNLLAAFTNRYFFSFQNLRELKELRKIVLDNTQKNEHPQEQAYSEKLFLEQKRRAWVLKLTTGFSFGSIHQNGNVYDAWSRFYGHETPIKQATISFKKLLIFPDSRLERKVINEDVIQQIEMGVSEMGIEVIRAHFGMANHPASFYTNFSELIKLIQEADFVISSDSLPAHIAQLLQKPHAIVYASKINHEWVTPFARANGWLFTFDTIEQLANKIKENIHSI